MRNRRESIQPFATFFTCYVDSLNKPESVGRLDALKELNSKGLPCEYSLTDDWEKYKRGGARSHFQVNLMSPFFDRKIK